MYSKAILLAAALCAMVSAQGTEAPITNNPVGAKFQAILKASNKTNIRGEVVITTNPDQTGVNVQMTIDGLPATGGPFPYHIHKTAVPADGNCSGTLTHLDPYGRGETPPCDATRTGANCEVGDLSGKHGTMSGNSTGFSANYVDLYVSTNPNNPAYLGGKSIVIHYPNKTRIACANFVQLSGGVGNASAPGPSYGSGSGSGSGSGNNAPAPTASAPAQFTGAAAVAGVAKGALALVAGGLVFAL